MSGVGFFVFDGRNGKSVFCFGDEKSADLSPQEATALAMIYLSDRISTHFDRLHDRLEEIHDRIGNVETAIETLGARLEG